MDPIQRWQKVCGSLPDGPTAYTYVAEHCRRKRQSREVKEEIERYEKDLVELHTLLPEIDAVVEERKQARMRARVRPWDPQQSLTVASVEAYLRTLAKKDQQNQSRLEEIPAVVARLHAAMVDMKPSVLSVEQRFQTLQIPSKYKPERAIIAQGVLRAFETTRRQQLRDLGVLAAPKGSKISPST